MSIRQIAVSFGEAENLQGIVTLPDQTDPELPFFIIPNAGVISKTGPNRLFVKIAFQLAERGIASLRFDFEGLGESAPAPIVEEYSIAKTKCILEAVDFLQTQYDARNFSLYGFCSSADLGFNALLDDERIANCILVNGMFLTDSEARLIHPMAEKANKVRYYKKYMMSLNRWKKLLSGNSKIFTNVGNMIWRKLRSRKNHSGGNKDSGIDLVNRWRNLSPSVRVLLIYAEGSVSYDVYRSITKDHIGELVEKRQVTVRVLNDIDHNFTMVWSQKLLIDILLAWILEPSQNAIRMENASAG